MSYPKFYKLVERLAKQTNAGKLQWKEAYRPDSYQVDFAEYSVGLTKGTIRESGERPKEAYTISITGPMGQTLDEFNNYELDASMPDWTYTETMKDLFEQVRRRVAGSEQAIDEILSRLEAGDEISPSHKPDDDEIPF